MSLYEKVVAAGIKHSNHASDLYIPVNEDTTKLIAEYEYKCNVTKFVSQIDGKVWFDVPFAFIPWWEARQNKQ